MSAGRAMQSNQPAWRSLRCPSNACSPVPDATGGGETTCALNGGLGTSCPDSSRDSRDFLSHSADEQHSLSRACIHILRYRGRRSLSNNQPCPPATCTCTLCQLAVGSPAQSGTCLRQEPDCSASLCPKRPCRRQTCLALLSSLPFRASPQDLLQPSLCCVCALNA